MQLECLANYIAELALLEYNMLCYASSIIAASSMFLAKYVLVPSKRPWVRNKSKITTLISSLLPSSSLAAPCNLC